MKNILNIEITRPSQVLIIMRGISGSGKSTKAKRLVSMVGKGVIHSTDDIITKTGDYRGFFNKMIESNDFGVLGKMHGQNLNNAIDSMKNDVSTVIIDNTCLTIKQIKPYVLAALDMGLSENNIIIMDIGTGGLSAEELAERNTHGVPLSKIKQMIQKYNSAGEITVKNIPNDWNLLADHMTIAFGKGVKDKNIIGREANLLVTHWAISDKVIAVRIRSFPVWLEVENAIPHITVAVNPYGGKPVMSNYLTKWQPLKVFVLNGIVMEIRK